LAVLTLLVIALLILSMAVVYLSAMGEPLAAGEVAIFYIPLIILFLLLSSKPDETANP